MGHPKTRLSEIGIGISTQHWYCKVLSKLESQDSYTCNLYLFSDVAVVSKMLACRVAEAILAYVAFEVSAKRLKEARSIFR